MNSFNDEVCEYNSEPVTENFFPFLRNRCPDGTDPDNSCPSGCRANGVGWNGKLCTLTNI